MSQLCAASKCNRTLRGLCDCCHQNLCLQHLFEHNASLISQLDPLTDEINTLGNRFKSMNIEKVVSSSHRKLEEWRDDCHQKIDRLFQHKCQELDRLVEKNVQKQHEELVRIQSKVADLIREQEATRQDIDSLTSTIHHLQEQMDKIEHTCFDIKTRSLVIDNSFIDFKELNELDLSTLSSVCKTINQPIGTETIITSNNRFLLMHRKPNLCLVDEGMNIVKEVLWNHDDIYDMCWSSTLNQFIIVGDKQIFLIDDETMAIENVQTIKEQEWLSCTCSETFLFLSRYGNGSSIMKFTLLPTIKLTKQWKPPQTCARDEIIDSIVYNNGTLGVIIVNSSEKPLRMELRSAETLDRIWSLPFNTMCNQNYAFRCCSLTCDDWLVADYESKCLLHVTKDGKLKSTITYDGIPYHTNVFANMLVISSGGVNFYKL